MKSISQIESEIKINGVSPGGGDRATLESDLSTLPAPSGEAPFFVYPDGVNAINSPSFSSSPSGGLVDHTIVNCDTVAPGGSTLPVIIEKFSEHRYKLEHTPCIFLHLRNKKDQSEAIYKFNPKLHSRYFPEGRANIQESIRQRLGNEVQPGVFLSLTVAASDWDIVEAWGVMWKRFKGFRDALNIYRKRHMNAKHSLLYLAAQEPHESDYPHMHAFYPGLRWLIKNEDLHKMDEWWGMGSVRTEKEHREESAQSYVLKYISKLEGWSEPAMAMLWYHRLRLYNLSHRFYMQAPDPEWEYIGRYNTPEEMGKYLKLSAGDIDKIIDTWRNLVLVNSS